MVNWKSKATPKRHLNLFGLFQGVLLDSLGGVQRDRLDFWSSRGWAGVPHVLGPPKGQFEWTPLVSCNFCRGPLLGEVCVSERKKVVEACVPQELWKELLSAHF